MAKHLATIEAMARHLTTKHPSVSQKSVMYFSRILEGEEKTAVRMVKRMTIGDTALEASFKVAELIAKKKETSYSWRGNHRPCM